jgi:hypothetical protein
MVTLNRVVSVAMCTGQMSASRNSLMRKQILRWSTTIVFPLCVRACSMAGDREEALTHYRRAVVRLPAVAHRPGPFLSRLPADSRQ